MLHERYPILENGIPDVLIAGHVVIDQIIDFRDSHSPRISLGGPVSYSSLALSSLNYFVEVVTKIGSDFPDTYSRLLREHARLDVEKFRISNERTTSFRIDRSTDPRKMWLLAKCKNLSKSDFFSTGSDVVSSRSKVLVVNSVAGEVSLSLLDRISKEFDLVLVDSQGFVRKFSKAGEVGMRSGLDISSLSGVDFLKADRAELSAWSGSHDLQSSIRQLSKFAEYIILTSGSSDVQVFHGDDLRWRIKPREIPVADTTGAGDIFLSVFAAVFYETENIKKSLAVATSAGSLAIQSFGIEKALLNGKEVLGLSESAIVLGY